MLVACRLAGLSALILDYAVKVAHAQCGPTRGLRTMRLRPSARNMKALLGGVGCVLAIIPTSAPALGRSDWQEKAEHWPALAGTPSPPRPCSR